MNEKTADRIKIRPKSTGGLESLIDTVAHIALIIGLSTGVGFLLLGGVSFLLRFVTSIQFLLATAITFVTLRGLAEIIRLLKHLNGLAYGGSISKVDESESFACGNCGAMVYNWDKCARCGAQINKVPPLPTPEPPSI